MAGNK